MIRTMGREYASLRRRPFLTPVWVLALAGIASVGLLTWAAWTVLAAPATFFVFFANAGVPGAEGRALRLAQLLGAGDARRSVEAVVAADDGALALARPLAARLAVPIIHLPALDAVALAHRLEAEFRGRRVLVVAPPALVASLVHRYDGDLPRAAPADGGAYAVALPRVRRA